MRGDHRLHDLAAALGTRDGRAVGLGLDHESGLLHIGPHILARVEAVLPLVGSAVLIDLCRLVQYREDRQVVALPNGVIVRVVSRRDFERAGPKLHAHILVRDHRDLAIQDRHDGFPTDELMVALIFRMNRYSCIAEDRFRADRRHRDKFVGVGELILEVIQCRVFLTVFHLEIRDRSLESRGPVDEARTAVDESPFVQAHEGLSHRAAESLVQGKAFTVPVGGGAEASDLSRDDAAVFLLPLPGALDKFFAPQLLARDLLIS